MAEEKTEKNDLATEKEQAEPEKKRNIWVPLGLFLAIVIFMAAVFGLVAYRMKNKTSSTKTTKTTASASKKTKESSIIQKQKPKPKTPAEDVEKYKDWQTYENMTWALFLRYPQNWTKSETIGNESLSVTFLGPATPAGGVVLNESTVSVLVDKVPASTDLQDYVDQVKKEPLGVGTIIEERDTSIAETSGIKVVDSYSDVGQPWRRQRIWAIQDDFAYTFTYKASVNYGGVDYYAMHSAVADMIFASVILP